MRSLSLRRVRSSRSRHQQQIVDGCDERVGAIEAESQIGSNIAAPDVHLSSHHGRGRKTIARRYRRYFRMPSGTLAPLGGPIVLRLAVVGDEPSKDGLPTTSVSGRQPPADFWAVKSISSRRHNGDSSVKTPDSECREINTVRRFWVHDFSSQRLYR